MKRLGDTMEWTSAGKDYEFDILASDQDRHRPASRSMMLSHPDSLGLVPLQLIEPGYGKIYCYFSWDGLRGTMDRNFLHTDGSVTRMMRIAGPSDGSCDSRLVRVPYQSDNPGDSASGYLPSVE